MLDVLRFWLDRGVDGFRVDVLWHLIKDDELRDNPPNPDWREGMDPYHALVPLYTTDRPEVHDIVRAMRALLDEYRERVLIGEIYLPLERLVHVLRRRPGTGVHLPFNFQLICRALGRARTSPALIAEYERAAARRARGRTGCSATTTGRASPRRVGPAQARVAAMLLLTLRGTPTLYYGDELGMQRRADPARARAGPVRAHGSRAWAWAAIPGARRCSGAPRRNAGFTTGEPWLPLAATSATSTSRRSARDPASMLALYRG